MGGVDHAPGLRRLRHRLRAPAALAAFLDWLQPRGDNACAVGDVMTRPGRPNPVPVLRTARSGAPSPATRDSRSRSRARASSAGRAVERGAARHDVRQRRAPGRGDRAAISPRRNRRRHRLDVRSGRVSNALAFTVVRARNPTPAITALSPRPRPKALPRSRCRSRARASSRLVVRWNGPARPTTFRATRLDAAIAAAISPRRGRRHHLLPARGRGSSLRSLQIDAPPRPLALPAADLAARLSPTLAPIATQAAVPSTACRRKARSFLHRLRLRPDGDGSGRRRTHRT